MVRRCWFESLSKQGLGCGNNSSFDLRACSNCVGSLLLSPNALFRCQWLPFLKVEKSLPASRIIKTNIWLVRTFFYAGKDEDGDSIPLSFKPCSSFFLGPSIKGPSRSHRQVGKLAWSVTSFYSGFLSFRCLWFFKS